MAWLPAVLACLVRADATRRPRWGALGGLALGVAFLAGHPQLFYHVVLAAVALGLTLVARARRRRALGRSGIRCSCPRSRWGSRPCSSSHPGRWRVASHRAGLGYDWKTTGSLLRPPRPGAVALGSDHRRGLANQARDLPLPRRPPPRARRSTHWCGGGTGGWAFTRPLASWPSCWPSGTTTVSTGPRTISCPGSRSSGFPRGASASRGSPSRSSRASARRRSSRDPGRATRQRGRRAGAGRRRRCRPVHAGPGVGPTAAERRRPPELREPVPDPRVLLAGSALVVSWPGRARPIGVRAAALVVLVADLVFGSYPVTDTPGTRTSGPRGSASGWRRSAARPSPCAPAGDHIHPQTIYRHGWGVVDGESTFAPPAFLDLYALGREHPHLVDLLNVRYVLPPERGRRTPREARELPARVARRPAPARPATRRARRARSRSTLISFTGPRRPGSVVATVQVISADGAVVTVPLRAGIETAEWSLDRPGAKAGTAARGGALVAGPAGYPGRTYRGTAELPRGPALAGPAGGRAGPGRARGGTLRRRRRPGVAAPTGARALPSRSPGTLENVRAFPRAFLVRRARRCRPRRCSTSSATWTPPRRC